MKMIPQQNVRTQVHFVTSKRLLDQFQKANAVAVILKNCSSPIAPCTNVIKCSFKFQAQCPSHPQTRPSIPNRQTTIYSRALRRDADNPVCALRLSLDRRSSFLLSPCRETAPFDRSLKRAGNSLRRLLSFFQNVFPIRRSPPS